MVWGFFSYKAVFSLAILFRILSLPLKTSISHESWSKRGGNKKRRASASAITESVFDLPSYNTSSFQSLFQTPVFQSTNNAILLLLCPSAQPLSSPRGGIHMPSPICCNCDLQFLEYFPIAKSPL